MTGEVIFIGAGKPLSRMSFNELRASRKADREKIADALAFIAEKRGATVTERREGPAVPGFNGQSIDLRFACNGVGAMVDIDDLHGGEWALIHWFNVHGPDEPWTVRHFSARFQRHCGDHMQSRPHHKATSHPRDWYSLAMMLDAGLMLAARGEAFEPAKVEASAA